MKVVELGSGQGFFSIELAKRGATVVGVELGEDLTEKARENAREAGVADKTAFVVAAAEKCDMVKADDADMVLVILALQNMRFIDDVVAQIARITKVGAKVVIVLNHPAFRVPKQSSWGYDRVMDKQYRRVDRYMSELEARIDMRPGATASKGAPVTETISFHRPLSAFVTAFGKKNMSMVAMEEWISHKESESGPRKAAEDTSRREIPLFMCMSFRKDA
jgi:ubiquinone/menaquinone biosynthesis C-methylase UbiE